MVGAEQIKELRAKTGAGFKAISEALEKSNGNMDEAIKYLREKGLAKAEKRKGKVASNGILGTYIHHNSKMAVIVEVACETDFAAKSPDMAKFAKDIAMHIAATNPKYINVENVEKESLSVQLADAEKGLEDKPEEIRKKIIEGRLEKFYQEIVLMKQKLFTDESKTVEDYYHEMVAKIGEKIEITKFYKVEVTKETVAASAATNDEVIVNE